MECYPHKSPCVGRKYQAELPSLIPSLMSKFDYYYLQDNSYNGEKSLASVEFGTGLPIPIICMKGQLINAVPNGSASVNVTDLRIYENSNVTNIEVHEQKNKCEGHYLGSKSYTWSEIEEASFILGLYIFGKNAAEVKKLVGTKSTGDIQAFYYRKFYLSDRYWRWYECNKNMKYKQCIVGSNIFIGQRQDEFLSRIRPHVAEECYRELLKVSKTFAAEKITLEIYVSILKTLIGLNILIEAVGIGTEKDLTGFHAESVKSTDAIPVGPEIFAVRDLVEPSAEKIIEGLRGDFRIKAQGKHLFWKNIWPCLVDRGWHFKLRHYGVDKSPLFFIPGVEKFSGKLVKGTHYFDSIIDIVRIVVSTIKLTGPRTHPTTEQTQRRSRGPKPPTPKFSAGKRRLTDRAMKACALADGSGNKNISSKKKESDFHDVMSLDKGKTSGTKGVSSSIVTENNPSEKVLPKNQKRGRIDAKKLKSIQNIIANGKNIVAVPPTSEKQKRLSGRYANLSMVPREEPIGNVTAKSFVAPKVNQTKRSNSLLNPNFGENTVSKETQPKTVVQSQSITNSIIKGEVLARSMIDLNLPALPDNEDDDARVAAIPKAVNHSEMNTSRRSTRTPIPSKRMLAYWETKDL